MVALIVPSVIILLTSSDAHNRTPTSFLLWHAITGAADEDDPSIT